MSSHRAADDQPLHLLLTNDDGIDAPGLHALHDHLVAAGHRVSVVAPARERSGCSQAISIWQPMSERRVERDGRFFGWGIDAMPADCVKVALAGLLAADRPRLVVSGINPGPNIGDAVFYSGTVGAAAEGALYGLPAIAVSIASRYGEERHFAAAAQFTVKLVARIARTGLPARTFLNVNAPNLPPDEIAGVVSTVQGTSSYLDDMHYHDELKGLRAVWRNEGAKMRLTPGDGDYDDRVLEQGFISVTPLRLDMTEPRMAGEVQRWLEEIMPGQVRHAAHVEAAPDVEAWSPFPQPGDDAAGEAGEAGASRADAGADAGAGAAKS